VEPYPYFEVEKTVPGVVSMDYSLEDIAPEYHQKYR
jgi:hypothetical protein